jgi:hypothetical protein
MRKVLAAAAVAAIIAVSTAAGAQRGPVLTPEKAAVVLWQAKAADEKCSVLAAADHDALINLAANAEIAAARSAGTDAATAALAKGRKQGEAMPCDAGTRAFVEDVFGSAGAAYAAAEAGTSAGEQPPRSGFTLFGRPSRSTQAEAPPPKPLPQVESGDVLGRFRLNTAAYLVELRCGHLRATGQRRFYEAVLAEQKRVVASKGRSAAAKAKAQAEALAKEQGACGRQTQALVRARYSDATAAN